jgi:molybdenum cofactor biosynthesis protein B
MGYQDHKQHVPLNVNCAVIIISDSRTEQTDESGKYIMDSLKEAGHTITSYSIIKNDASEIIDKIGNIFKDNPTQVIITSGGTGASHMDITIETITPMLEKKMEGFGELFRNLTYQEIGSGSILSRAMAGVIKGRIIISLPGSLDAVKLAMDKIIIPEIAHLVREASR